MKNLRKIAICVFAVLFVYASAYAQSNDLKIVIIRHGEKPKKGDNLNCKGLSRSMMLPKVLNAKFGVPNYTYIPNLKCDTSTKHSRMFETLIPFASKYNLVINSHYKNKDSAGIANDVMAKHGTVLICWDHNYITPFVHVMGVNQKLKWADDDFDSIWIITYKDGKAVLTLDKEDLKPSDDCPF